MSQLESMKAFFAARVDGYDEHMMNNVEGCKEGYIKMASLIPKSTDTLLDLGCGTGLELDEIFKVLPDIRVTGIDLTQEMLDVLKSKHPDKNMELICGDYFSTEFGKYDIVISFETMHHFSKSKKTELYKRILNCLNDKGIYLECDYMAGSQEEEDFFFSENSRLRAELGIGENEYYHYDTPCTVNNQIDMLNKAGFKDTELVFRMGGTVMLKAIKHLR